MAYLLVNKETLIIDNIIELSENGYTTTFIENERGDRFPTSEIDGKLVITNQYLIPENYDVYLSDKGRIGQSYPIIEEQPAKGE